MLPYQDDINTFKIQFDIISIYMFVIGIKLMWKNNVIQYIICIVVIHNCKRLHTKSGGIKYV